jgi:hypothetical protein
MNAPDRVPKRLRNTLRLRGHPHMDGGSNPARPGGQSCASWRLWRRWESAQIQGAAALPWAATEPRAGTGLTLYFSGLNGTGPSLWRGPGWGVRGVVGSPRLKVMTMEGA